MAYFKEFVKGIIVDQDEKVDSKPKKKLQPFALQIKDISQKLGEKDN